MLRVIRHPIVVMLVSAVVFMALAFGAFYFVIKVVVRGSGEVEVPSITAMSIGQAWEKLDEVGLNLRRSREDFSDVVPKGGIIWQDPPAGSKVKPGRDIMVVISKGSQLIKVPDLRGRELRDAEQMLRNEGLSVGHASWMYRPTTKELVLAQAPPPGTAIPAAAGVNVLVSAGLAPGRYMLPDFIGTPLDDARQALVDMGMEVVEREVDAVRAASGRVLSQEPKGGTVVVERTPVVLTVKGKVEPVSQFDYVVLDYHVPLGYQGRVVTIKARDRTGTGLVLQKAVDPGASLRVPVRCYGKTVVEVFLDGRMVEHWLYDGKAFQQVPSEWVLEMPSWFWAEENR